LVVDRVRGREDARVPRVERFVLLIGLCDAMLNVVLLSPWASARLDGPAMTMIRIATADESACLPHHYLIVQNASPPS